MANEDPEIYIQNRLQVFRQCRAFEREHKSGEWFLSRELRMPDGGTMSIRTDISDLKRATGALKESELHLKMALESFPKPLAIYDPGDRIIIYNDRFTNQIDWSAPYFIPGASFEETLREAVQCREYPAAFEREEAYIRERLDQRTNKSFDYESYKADGQIFRHLGGRLAKYSATQRLSPLTSA